MVLKSVLNYDKVPDLTSQYCWKYPSSDFIKKSYFNIYIKINATSEHVYTFVLWFFASTHIQP